jgi:hypothetical protein
VALLAMIVWYAEHNDCGESSVILEKDSRNLCGIQHRWRAIDEKQIDSHGKGLRP